MLSKHRLSESSIQASPLGKDTTAESEATPYLASLGMLLGTIDAQLVIIKEAVMATFPEKVTGVTETKRDFFEGFFKSLDSKKKQEKNFFASGYFQSPLGKEVTDDSFCHYITDICQKLVMIRQEIQKLKKNVLAAFRQYVNDPKQSYEKLLEQFNELYVGIPKSADKLSLKDIEQSQQNFQASYDALINVINNLIQKLRPISFQQIEKSIVSLKIDGLEELKKTCDIVIAEEKDNRKKIDTSNSEKYLEESNPNELVADNENASTISLTSFIPTSLSGLTTRVTNTVSKSTAQIKAFTEKTIASTTGYELSLEDKMLTLLMHTIKQVLDEVNSILTEYSQNTQANNINQDSEAIQFTAEQLLSKLKEKKHEQHHNLELINKIKSKVKKQYKKGKENLQQCKNEIQDREQQAALILEQQRKEQEKLEAENKRVLSKLGDDPLTHTFKKFHPQPDNKNTYYDFQEEEIQDEGSQQEVAEHEVSESSHYCAGKIMVGVGGALTGLPVSAVIGTALYFALTSSAESWIEANIPIAGFVGLVTFVGTAICGVSGIVAGDAIDRCRQPIADVGSEVTREAKEAKNKLISLSDSSDEEEHDLDGQKKELREIMASATDEEDAYEAQLGRYYPVQTFQVDSREKGKEKESSKKPTTYYSAGRTAPTLFAREDDEDDSQLAENDDDENRACLVM